MSVHVSVVFIRYQYYLSVVVGAPADMTCFSLAIVDRLVLDPSVPCLFTHCSGHYLTLVLYGVSAETTACEPCCLELAI